MPPRKHNGHIVSVLRERHGLTVGQLAERAGVNQFTIYRIERGRRTLPKTAVAIARALDVPLDTLYRPDINPIKRQRLLRGWTIWELAQRAGLSVTTIEKMEQGDKATWIRAYGLVAGALDVPVDSIITAQQGGS